MIRRCSWRTAVLLPVLLLLLPLTSARAAPPAGSISLAAANVAALTQAVGAEPGTAAPLPLAERAAPARTLRPYWHVFVGFAIAWLLLFGYVVSLGRRFGRLEREIDSLR